MEMNRESRVGRISTAHPLATRVFNRHGIDFCCGGNVALQEACEAKSLDTGTVLDEIRLELEKHEGDGSGLRWDEVPLEALIDHILDGYHKPLREELLQLETMARKVARVHHDKEPEMLPELLSVYLDLKLELEQHMEKEEQILFPMIRQGRGAMAAAPITVMEEEHRTAGDALGRLRSLTSDYGVPDEACTTWRALWLRLLALEEALHEHIHLENNILFPRALSG